MSQEPQITYIFGAGASAQALPTIKGLPDSILKVHDYIAKNYLIDDDVYLNELNWKFKAVEAKEILLKLLLELYESSKKYSTIDTYAKHLYLNNNSNDNEKLRFALSVYFSIVQKISDKDARYETFLISLLESSIYLFPKNVKFLSWNYDLQLEYAYSKISESNLISRLSTFSDRYTEDENSFASVKINGACTFNDSARKTVYSFVDNPDNKDLVKGDLDFILTYAYLFFEKHVRSYYSGRPGISYSWYHESYKLHESIILTKNTTHLVVIGYSFPFFNREVDRKIIRAMPNLQRIYIQDLFPENISSRFLSILPDYKTRGIEIIPITNVDEFFLPPEL